MNLIITMFAMHRNACFFSCPIQTSTLPQDLRLEAEFNFRVDVDPSPLMIVEVVDEQIVPFHYDRRGRPAPFLEESDTAKDYTFKVVDSFTLPKGSHVHILDTLKKYWAPDLKPGKRYLVYTSKPTDGHLTWSFGGSMLSKPEVIGSVLPQVNLTLSSVTPTGASSLPIDSKGNHVLTQALADALVSSQGTDALEAAAGLRTMPRPDVLNYGTPTMKDPVTLELLDLHNKTRDLIQRYAIEVVLGDWGFGGANVARYNTLRTMVATNDVDWPSISVLDGTAAFGRAPELNTYDLFDKSRDVKGFNDALLNVKTPSLIMLGLSWIYQGDLTPDQAKQWAARLHKFDPKTCTESQAEWAKMTSRICQTLELNESGKRFHETTYALDAHYHEFDVNLALAHWMAKYPH